MFSGTANRRFISSLYTPSVELVKKPQFNTDFFIILRCGVEQKLQQLKVEAWPVTKN